MKPLYYSLFVRGALLLLVVSTNLFAQGSQTNYLQGLLNQAKTSQRTKQASLFSLSSAVTYNASAFRAGQRPVTLTIDNNGLRQIVEEQPALLQLSIPTGAETLELELVPVDLFMPNSKLLLGTQNGTQEAPFQKGLFYQGFIKNKTRSLVSISIIEGEMAGFVSDESGNRVLSRLKQNPNGYLFYKDNTIAAQKEFVCATNTSKANVQLTNTVTAESAGCKVVGIYFEADYQMYQDNGSNVTTTTNFITGLFNQVATIYNKENIAIRIAGIKIWTTTDPYATATTSGQALDLFRVYQNNNPPPGVSHQLAHLLSTRGLGGGIAYLDVLCNAGPFKYGFSGSLSTTYQYFPNYSWEVMVVSHELGHNFGSPHTQSCTWVGGPIDNCVAVEDGTCAPGPPPTNGGTIMSYCHLTGAGINLANGFGQQPGDLIRNRVAAGACVPAASGVPTDLAVRNIRATLATVYWVSNSGSTSFTLQYRPVSSGTWTTVGPFLGAQYTLTGLQPNTAYVWKVTGDCAGDYSAEATFTTGQPSYCTPTYASDGCGFGIGLKSVTLNGTALTTNSGCALTYFTYYPTPVGSVSKTNPNPFTVEFLDYFNAQQVTIWIDFNNDYEFDATEKVFATTSGYQVPVNGNLTIPSTAPTGVTRRMRVRNQFSSPVTDACATLGYGETEDYLVTIQGAAEPTMYTTQTGNWNNPAIWSGNRVPIASDVLTIQAGHIITMPASYTGAAKSMSVLGRINYQANAKILLGQ